MPVRQHAAMTQHPGSAKSGAYARATDAASASSATASSISASDTVSGGTSRTTSPLPAVMAIRPLSIASLHTGPAGCVTIHTKLRNADQKGNTPQSFYVHAAVMRVCVCSRSSSSTRYGSMSLATPKAPLEFTMG